MESLQLPMDLHWEMKAEPLSPSQLACTSFEELPLFEDNFADEFFSDDTIILDTKISTFEKLQEILKLNDALNEDIILEKDQWLEQKVALPFTDEYSPEPIGFYPIKATNTEELLMEFESVYDAVEYTHLTPPQTPPEINKHSSLETVEAIPFYASQQALQFSHNISTGKLLDKQTLPNNEDIYTFSFIPDSSNIAQELEEVEELVRSRAKDLPDWNDDDDSFEGSSSSSCLSPRSDTSYCESKTSQDDEWYPERKTTKVKRKYSRSTDDRKSRKKEQNKNAATRYRQKKKQEIEEILGEERVLLDINGHLQTKYNDLKREKKYLKSLLRELYGKNGLLKNE